MPLIKVEKLAEELSIPDVDWLRNYIKGFQIPFIEETDEVDEDNISRHKLKADFEGAPFV